MVNMSGDELKTRGCVPDPDTHLLAEYLCAAFHEALDEGVGSALAWYRVAERAKELRA